MAPLLEKMIEDENVMMIHWSSGISFEPETLEDLPWLQDSKKKKEESWHLEPWGNKQLPILIA